MSGLDTSSVTLGNGSRNTGSKLETTGQVASQILSAPVHDEENCVYDVENRVNKVRAVASLVTGSYDQREADRAYKNMDIQNDSYLKEIGYNSSNSGAELQNAVSQIQFRGTVEAQASKDYMMDATGNIRSTPYLSGSELKEIASTGTANVGGVTYNASIGTDGIVSLSSNAETFRNASSISIDLDPTASLSTMSAIVPKSSFNAQEISAINSGNNVIDRGGIKYTVAQEAGNYRVSSMATIGSSNYNDMLASVNAPFNKVVYTMNGTASVAQATQAMKTGSYNLGGVTFSATGNLNQFRTAYDKFNNENANAMRDMSASSITRHSRQNAIADIQAKGTDYIRKQSDFLSQNFKGTRDSATKCQAELKLQIASAKRSGDAKLVSQLQKQSDLLREWKKHGGNASNPTHNKRARQGKMILAQSVMGSDTMRSVQTYTSIASTTMTAYRATTGAARKLNYMGSSFANKVTSNALKKVAGSDNLVSQQLDKIQGNKKARYDRRKAKDQARANGTMKQYRRNRRDERWSGRAKKLDGKVGKLGGLRKADDGKRLGAKDRVHNARVKRAQNRRDRFSRVSSMRRSVREFPGNVKGFVKRNTIGRLNETRFVKGARRVKNKFLNSKVGKGLTKSTKFIGKVLKFPGKVFRGIHNILDFIKRWFMKIVYTAIGSYIALYCACLAPVAIAYLFTRFFSTDTLTSVLDGIEFKTEWEERLNSSVNWTQLIVDVVDLDIASDFVLISQVDATNHFLSKKQIASDNYPWYRSPNFGEVNNLWAWEEADNFSRYLNGDYEDGSGPEVTWTEGGVEYSGKAGEYDNIGRLIGDGDLMYEDYYVPESEREQLDSVSFNLLPIISMAHIRYSDEFSYEEWTTVLGYTYYMFSVSHDIAKYDTNATYIRNQYGDYSFDPGYDYAILDNCPNAELYNGEIEWDPESHTLTRPNDQCTNVYIHDFSPIGFESAIKSDVGRRQYKSHWVSTGGTKKKDVASYSLATGGSSGLWDSITTFFGTAARSFTSSGKAVISETAKLLLKGKINEKDFVSQFLSNAARDDAAVDPWDRGYTDMNDLMTIALRKNSLKGINKETGETHADISFTIQQLAAEHQFLLDFKPNESGIFLWDGTEDSLPHAQPVGTDDLADDLHGYGEVCDNYKEFCYGKQEDTFRNRKEDLLLDDDPGHVDGCHVHKLECHKLVCEEPEKATTYNADGSVDELGHIHSVDCYDTTPEGLVCGHNHHPWNGKDDPGCWKTVTVCAGHCGGHIQPYVNIVQKVTWKGLAEDDNFKTPHWLTFEEITNCGGMLTGGMYGLLDSILEDHIATVAQFRGYWYGKCNNWFSPMPRSLYSYNKKITLTAISKMIKCVDGISEFFDGLFRSPKDLICTKGNGARNEDGTRHYHTVEAGCYADDSGNTGNGMTNSSPSDDWTVNQEEGDVENWDGWWRSEDGEFDWTYYDEGSWVIGFWEEDRYANAEANWEDMGEASIVWPKTGVVGVALSPEEIDEIINGIMAELKYMDGVSSELRENILQIALDLVGKVKYGKNGHGHGSLYAGANGGMDDCSGFVSAVLKRAGLDLGSMTTATLAAKSTYGGTISPGSIITRYSPTATNNHTMIYVGYREDGPEGPGTYVIDCSSDKGYNGSAYRKYDEKRLKAYKYVYNP